MSDERYVPRMAVGLLHYPILDSSKRIVSTNVTNFDVHDIARACRVYGVEKYYIIHPMRQQLMFVERILDHWRVGAGAKFNSKRKSALTMVRTAENLDQALKDWGVADPMIVATHARSVPGAEFFTFPGLKAELHEKKRPCFLLFGTGFGITHEYMKNCTAVLEGIRGAPPDDYRHLSVRSAASIILDRLMGPW